MAKFTLDPTAAAAAAKKKRKKAVEEAAGAKILEITEAANLAVNKGDVAGLNKVLSGRTDGTSDTDGSRSRTKPADDAKKRTPRKPRGSGTGGTPTSTLGSKLRGRRGK